MLSFEKLKTWEKMKKPEKRHVENNIKISRTTQVVIG